MIRSLACNLGIHGLNCLYRGGLGLLGRLPSRLAVVMAGCLGLPLAVWQSRRRFTNYRRVLSTNGCSFRKLLVVDLRTIAFQCNFVVTMARMFRLAPEEVKAGFTLSGREQLETALMEGRGVLLIGAHFGNWFMVSLGLHVHGYKVPQITGKFPLPAYAEDIARLRQRFEIEGIMIGDGGASVAAGQFQKGAMFSTLVDTGVRADRSAWIPFGHASMRVDLGPARLAIRHGVPVVLALHRPEASGHGRVYFIRAPGGDATSDAEKLMEMWLALLRDEIERTPEFWGRWGFVRLMPREIKSP